MTRISKKKAEELGLLPSPGKKESRLKPSTGAVIILPGRPITKKNSQRIIFNKVTGRRMVIQSKKYLEYEKECLWQLKQYRDKHIGPVQVTARYWMPDRRSWPDLMGLLQATCDILERAGIIENDKNVVRLDGSEIVGVDRENPRVEVEVIARPES